MFTGIIEELGEISQIHNSSNGGRITIAARKVTNDTSIGDSISVNGVCLTVVDVGPDHLTMDILRETYDRSTLSSASAGDKVNLERSLTPSSRIGGHFVFGHVDCQGKVIEINRTGRDWLLRFSIGPGLLPFIAEKGSIAIDGISLTIAEVSREEFTVHIIPYTYEQTTLQLKRTGGNVNIEVDMLARYVQRAISSPHKKDSPITEDYLREKGFA